uniref:Uncharacterized protein n=1 Tax=Oryza glumipatula TaxID=40148 RepID=A0A1Y8Z585_9ORYZ
MIISFDN